MMSGPIDQMDQGSRNSVVPIMYRNGPDVDEDKERNIDHLVQGEDEWIDMVG